MRNLTLVLTATVMSAALLSPGWTHAAASGSVTLRYAPSELATVAGRERTYRRLHAAAGEVCARHLGQELARKATYRRCISASLTAALVSLGDSRLLALHEVR